ncbi:MAG: amino acid ABC transporter permease [Pseudonocardiales bacterium]|nr:MAG: amino acid ABC transporter permease [Pseudonocardiales bacterium]
MSSGATVLYDHPGPKARTRNLIFSIIFGILLALLVWWVVNKLNSKHELTAQKWKPFTTGNVWSNFLIPGLLATIKAAVLSVLIALPIGAVLAVGRMSDHRWVRWPCSVVVEFFRAIPVLILMIFANEFFFQYSNVSSESRPLYAVVTGLVLYNASVLAEILRSGIRSLPYGQTEASQAIGLRKTQMMTLILLPQALTAMLPSIVSQLVVVLKDTALGSVAVNYSELLAKANNLTANFSNTVATYGVVAVLYITMNFILTVVASRLEKWMRNRRGGKRMPRRVDPELELGAA